MPPATQTIDKVMLTTMTNCLTNVINKQSHGLECNFGNNCMATSGVRYSNFSYHDIGAISITIRYISRYNLWFEITMKHYYEVND